MIQLRSWLQQAWVRPDRLGTTSGVIALILLVSVSAALMITLSPGIGAVLAAIIAIVFLTEHILPPAWATIAPLLLLFLTPADDIVGLSGDRRGFFMLAAGTVLAATTFIRGRIRVYHGVQLILPALVATQLAVDAIHVSKGQVRGAIVWLAAFGVWIWLDGRTSVDPTDARRRVENAIIASGAISGGIGLLEFLRVVDPTQWIPGYEPDLGTFTQEIGNRAVGLSGHSLRFGTLCMLGCTLAIIRFALDRRRRRTSPWLVASLVASGAGLIVSGARGSWLALLCGLAFALAATIQSRRLSGELVIRGSVFAVAIAGLVMASGLGFLVRERLVGAATAPASIGQRVVAFQSIVDSLPDLPIFGVGHGGAAEFLLRGGAIIPNIENEYLIALVAGGPLAMLVLVMCVGWTIRTAFRNAIASRESAPLALCVALCVNIATFNLFSWSAGPPLFATVTALAVLTRGSLARPSGDP